MPIDPAKLREWARLAKAATPQWSAETGVRGPHLIGRLPSGRPNGEVIAEFDPNSLSSYDDLQQGLDAMFAVAAREAVPALIEALVEERAEARYYHEQTEGALINPHVETGDLILWLEAAEEVRRAWRAQARRELGVE